MSEVPLLTWKGRRVRSPGDGPETAARKVPEAPRPGSLFFVPSPLEGWGLPLLLERLPSDSVVVVFEIDPDLSAHCQTEWEAHLGPALSDARLHRLEEDNEAAVQTLFRSLPLSHLRRCEFLTLNGAWLSHGPRYREVFARVDHGLTRWWANRLTCIHMGPLWIRNLFDNLARPETSFAPWPRWGSKTTFVCGAGPTLEGALPWLREHRSEVRIVAADTALPVFRASDLVPDAVVCLEAQHANLRDFAGWKGADVALFADLTSYPPGTRVFARPPHWFISRFADLALWERWPWSADLVPLLPPLGSVGVAAAWVAWGLTTGPVVLAGLDFSYPSGKTHARGAPHLEARIARNHRLSSVESPGSWANATTRPGRGNWLTTAVLEGYAGVLAEQARPHAHRTSTWSDEGLNLGLRKWECEVLPSVDAAPQTTIPGLTSPQAWAKGEALRWESLLRRLGRSLEAEAETKVLQEELRALDYLTFSFPDPEFRAQPDWLVRVRALTQWLWRRQTPSAR